MQDSRRSARTAGAQTLVDLLERQFRERPAATAIRTAARSWTYAELDRLSARLVRRLVAEDAGSIVGLLSRRCPAALICIVAILRSGAACLPMNPDDPPLRNSGVLDEVGCKRVLATEPVEWLPDAQFVDEDGVDPGDDGRATAPLPSPRPLDLAYALTTSGSTGRPKIVGVPHEGLLNLIVASFEDMDLIRTDDVMLWTTALTVDSTMHDCLMPLCFGACVAVDDGGDLPANRILHAVRALGVTALEVPAAVLGPYGQALLPRLAAEGVRLVITGGSQLDGPGLGSNDSLVVHNGYGPTEASVAATWYPCDRTTPRWVPIGRPIRNVRTYVLDGELNAVPAGEIGQLYLAGAGLARGYLGRPARTAAAFLPDPFSSTPGERMYATGDNVRLQPDGNFVYVGRIDDQVKISGYRVEIGEVEHRLRACRGVLDAAALLREDLPGAAAIVAYLVGERLPDEALTSQLNDWLPTPMIPRFFVWLEEMPLNRSGKIDRRALAAIPLGQPDPV
ncbi:amino acid adenylation domain-containing protein [Amycolatopsis sp. WGS_07]|uniref:amino acid adenylation domain-containing protein n=1 Tax=Amycolatopsis sp. WGS_07 TaxID=3076764 RepID=UPI0038736B55